MATDFVPDGFCGFSEMRKAAYLSKYPAPAEDEALLDACRQDQPADLSKFGLDDVIGHVPSAGQQVLSAIEDGSFDLERSLLPPHLDIRQHIEIGDIAVTGHLVPESVEEIGKGRWADLFRTLRGLLYEENLTPHYADPIRGVVSLYSDGSTTHAVWLDDREASHGLVEGTMRLNARDSRRHALLFERKEVESLFSSLRGVPTQQERVLAALVELYPAGIPSGYGNVADARRKIAEERNLSVSDSVWARARSDHRKAVEAGS